MGMSNTQLPDASSGRRRNESQAAMQYVQKDILFAMWSSTLSQRDVLRSICKKRYCRCCQEANGSGWHHKPVAMDKGMWCEAVPHMPHACDEAKPRLPEFAV
mmetsp:Transcript_46712/g.108919  ORF Transcript_46712/g.108919 Transcript_46712/m.108919 type:complete len:102 (+) Transcript_46712:961-1266(+)